MTHEIIMLQDVQIIGMAKEIAFDKAYLSYECGLMKPDPALFSLICHREAIQPSESLFVDDGEKNTHAASLLGFHTLCPPDGTDWTEPLSRLLRDKGAFPLS